MRFPIAVILGFSLASAACGSSGVVMFIPDGEGVLAGDAADPGGADALDIEMTDAPLEVAADADVPSAPDDTADADAGLDVGDATGSDAADGHEDTGPVSPFAGCDSNHPCKDAAQGLCLMLPGQDGGVCVQPCVAGPSAGCPPWQECVYIDDKNSACFELASWGDACSRSRGVLCDAARMEYCLDRNGPADPGRCTSYCNPANPACAPWQECVALPGGTSSACFARSPAPECTDGLCPAGTACRNGRCLATCGVPVQCGVGQSCVDAGPEKVCVPDAAPAGVECAPEVGVECDSGLECLPAEGDWMGYCAASCALDTECPPFTRCAAGKCRRFDRLVPGVEPCGGNYTCSDPQRMCYPLQPDMGLCLSPCSSGECSDGGSCQAGFCVHGSGPGQPCSPELGLPCGEGWICRVDETLDHHFGHCTRPCADGCDVDGLPEGSLSCVDGWCERSVAYGGECSDVAGIRCGPGGDLHCQVFNSALRSGICTRKCTLGEACPQPFEGADAQCLLADGTDHYCAMMCMTGDCPDFLTCHSPGICLY